MTIHLVLKSDRMKCLMAISFRSTIKNGSRLLRYSLIHLYSTITVMEENAIIRKVSQGWLTVPSRNVTMIFKLICTTILCWLVAQLWCLDSRSVSKTRSASWLNKMQRLISTSLRTYIGRMQRGLVARCSLVSVHSAIWLLLRRSMRAVSRTQTSPRQFSESLSIDNIISLEIRIFIVNKTKILSKFFKIQIHSHCFFMIIQIKRSWGIFLMIIKQFNWQKYWKKWE